MPHATNSLDTQWMSAYDAFSTPLDMPTTLKKLTDLACEFAPWTISGILAVDSAGGFVELMAETGNRGPIFSLLPTRWPLVTSPCKTVLATGEMLFFDDVKVCSQYPMYHAEAVAQDFQSGVVMLLDSADASGRPLVWMLQSQYGQRASQEQFAVAHRLVQFGNRAIERALAHERAQSERHRLESLAQLGSDLMDEVFKGATLADLVSLGGRRADARLAIVDVLGEQVHYSAPADELLGDLLGCLEAGAGRAAEEPFAVCLVQGLRVLIEPLAIAGQAVGAVVLLGSREDAQAFERSVLRQVKGAAGAVLLRNHVDLGQRSRELKALFEQLENGLMDNVDAQARLCQVNLRRPAQLLLIECAEACVIQGERRLQGLVPGATLCELAPYWLLRLPCECSGLGQGMMSRLLHALQTGVSEPLRIASSAVLQSAEGYAPAIKCLKQLLTLAATFGRDGLVDDKSFGPFTFLAAALDKQAAPEFVASTIGAIQAYDQQHHTRLLETCVAFSEVGCRYQECAGRLNIHVSTLRYRLARIAELFAIDFANPDARFSLELAFRLARVLNPGPALDAPRRVQSLVGASAFTG